LVRCAIYTRKSTDEGLDKEFNSLDAQRESAEAFIRSQQHEGWTCLEERYDDGGFSGGTLERPALQRLLREMEAGRVDCVVVYKVDRLSRSLLDFSRMMDVFDKHRVSFVSVTQQFNTGTSMGRLVLNVLLSFAQFEREIISERTRDKVAAARRKGKWSGGTPLLGYDLDLRGSKLLVNELEAVRVRAIFELYLAEKSLLCTVQELERRGWHNKRWTTRAGRERGGKLFTKTSLHNLLTNIAYLGKLRYKGEVFAGEHAAIVAEETWQQVQAMLASHGRSGAGEVRNSFGALLKGLLHCSACECAMSPMHTTKNGTKRYRYYVCTGAQKRGWHTCPSKSLPAGELERFVVEQIESIGRDPAVVQETLRPARREVKSQLAACTAEQTTWQRELERTQAEVQRLSTSSRQGTAPPTTGPRLAELQTRITEAEQRLREFRVQARALRQGMIEPAEVAHALGSFTEIWATLAPREQARVLALLIARIDYHGGTGKLTLTFHPNGLKSWTDERALASLEKPR